MIGLGIVGANGFIYSWEMAAMIDTILYKQQWDFLYCYLGSWGSAKRITCIFISLDTLSPVTNPLCFCSISIWTVLLSLMKMSEKNICAHMDYAYFPKTWHSLRTLKITLINFPFFNVLQPLCPMTMFNIQQLSQCTIAHDKSAVSYLSRSIITQLSSQVRREHGHERLSDSWVLWCQLLSIEVPS